MKITATPSPSLVRSGVLSSLRFTLIAKDLARHGLPWNRCETQVRDFVVDAMPRCLRSHIFFMHHALKETVIKNRWTCP